jgi:hypothetical protein
VSRTWTPPAASVETVTIRTLFVGLRHEDELSPRRRVLEHLVRVPRLGQRQALRHDRVDVAAAEQFEQGAEVLPEPPGVALLAADWKRA